MQILSYTKQRIETTAHLNLKWIENKSVSALFHKLLNYVILLYQVSFFKSINLKYRQK